MRAISLTVHFQEIGGICASLLMSRNIEKSAWTQGQWWRKFRDIFTTESKHPRWSRGFSIPSCCCLN